MVKFDHRDDGTPEEVWARSDHWASVILLESAHVDDAVIIAAHPDDETLGAGGLIAQLYRLGTRITLVLATHGERSHARDLTLTRLGEFKAAAYQLAPGCRFVDVGLPDGDLLEHRHALESRLVDVIADADLVVAPWRGDGHRDHRVAGEVAAAVAARHGVPLMEYPIWLWHWAEPDSAEVPWSDFVRLPLAREDSELKRLALDAYVSQLGEVDGEEPIIHDGMKAHFLRSWETFVVPSS